MSRLDPALLRAAKAYAKQDYDRQVVQDSGSGSSDYGNAGPPTWNRSAWEAFRNQYGRWPWSASELPPFDGNEPDWVYDLIGIRRPPVRVNLRQGL